MTGEPLHQGPRIGDPVQVEAAAEVVELLALGGVPGAVVELDPGRASLVLDGQPDGARLPRVWLPLDSLVVLRQPEASA